MRRHPLLVVATVLAAAVVSLLVRYHLTGPRLTFMAVARPGLTRAECIAEVQHFGYGIGADVCSHPAGRPAFHAVVTNVGGRGAWVSTCTIDALDAAGKPIPGLTSVDVPMWLTRGGVGARPYLAPGKSASLDWFLPQTPTTTVDSYRGSCSFVVYRHPPV